MGRKRPKTIVPAPSQAAPEYIRPHLSERVVAIGYVQRDRKNCKKHADKDLAAIMASLREFGQVRPIVVDANTKTIIAGNGTHEAAQRLGWEFIAVDFVADLTPAQLRAFALADNRSAQLSEWDEIELGNYLAEIASDAPELYDALLLEDLVSAEQTSEDCLPKAVQVPESFACVVTVPTEAAQKKLFAFLTTHGYHDLKLITT